MKRASAPIDYGQPTVARRSTLFLGDGAQLSMRVPVSGLLGMVEGMLMRLLGRCGWCAGLGVPVLVAVLLGLANPAEAAFPGRNGLLAVQSLKASGVVLVEADGGGERRLCQGSTCVVGCSGNWCFVGVPLRPAWSPDGRVLAVSVKKGYLSYSAVVYPDGSCLFCAYSFTPGETAFMANPTLLTGVVMPAVGPLAGVVEFGIDGLARKVLLSGQVSDPVWSSRGELAVVRGGWLWVGSPGKLRRLTPGSAPSWSPNGRQIAFQRRGSVLMGQVRGRSFRRLVRGTAPAWSPDGKWIAFFGEGHRLNLVPAAGGPVRHVGTVTGTTVDWQPLPAKPPTSCLTPAGSNVLASSEGAILSTNTVALSKAGPLDPYGYSALMGCLRADGRERWLASIDPSSVTKTALAGNYAALVTHFVNIKYFDNQGDKVTVFDLGAEPQYLGGTGESVDCGLYNGSSCAIDQLVLGSDAVSAVHATVKGQDTNGNTCSCTVEQIQATDRAGLHILDSVTESEEAPPALTNLALTGDTLTWDHNGSPHSAQLQP